MTNAAATKLTQPVVIDVEQLTPSTSTSKLGAFCRKYWKLAIQPFAKWALEKKLSALFKAAKDYDANLIPAGDPVYKALLRDAKAVITEFCRKYEIDQAKLERQIS